MKETIHLQNVHCEGCVHNVKTALEMIDGVKVAHVHKEDLVVDVLYEAPATPLEMREQLLMGGYLAEPKSDRH